MSTYTAKHIESGIDSDGTEWDTYEIHEDGEYFTEAQIMPSGHQSIDESILAGQLNVPAVAITH